MTTAPFSFVSRANWFTRRFYPPLSYYVAFAAVIAAGAAHLVLAGRLDWLLLALQTIATASLAFWVASSLFNARRPARHRSTEPATGTIPVINRPLGRRRGTPMWNLLLCLAFAMYFGTTIVGRLV